MADHMCCDLQHIVFNMLRMYMFINTIIKCFGCEITYVQYPSMWLGSVDGMPSLGWLVR